MEPFKDAGWLALLPFAKEPLAKTKISNSEIDSLENPTGENQKHR